MVGDPAADGHTDRGDAGASQEHSRLLGMHLASNLELLKHRQDRLVQPLDVSRDRQPSGFERHDQVGRELARKMEDASTPSVDPVDLHPVGPQVVVVGQDVSPASRSAHADRRWMLAEDQAGSPALAELVDELPLELLDFLEVDEAEQVDLERGGLGGRLHRLSIPGPWRAFRERLLVRSGHPLVTLHAVFLRGQVRMRTRAADLHERDGESVEKPRDVSKVAINSRRHSGFRSRSRSRGLARLTR